jgi:hypothetical protein
MLGEELLAYPENPPPLPLEMPHVSRCPSSPAASSYDDEPAPARTEWISGGVLRHRCRGAADDDERVIGGLAWNAISAPIKGFIHGFRVGASETEWLVGCE